MTDKELKRLNRRELLEMMLEQSKIIDAQQTEIERLEKELDNKRLQIKNSGSIAEAALKLSGIFEAAQKAADIYLDNVKARGKAKRAMTDTVKRNKTKGKNDAWQKRTGAGKKE